MTTRVARALRYAFVAITCGAVSAFAPASTRAATFDFDCITDNSAPSCAAGELQLLLEVTDLGSGLVQFELRNSAQTGSSITDIYLDEDDPLLAWLYRPSWWSNGSSDSSGVDFDLSNADNANPGDLPGGNGVGFDADHSWDSNPPTTANGINGATEWVRLVFSLNTGTFATVLNALQTGTLRLGLHVQGFPNGSSEGFLNRTGTPGDPGVPGNPVPEPTSMLLLGSGLAGVAAARRRRRA